MTRYELVRVKRILKEINFAKIPERDLAGVASVARRVGLLKDSLKILQNQIYGTGHASPLEIIEYASGLRKLGLINQALTLLSRVKEHEQASLHTAFCHINRWDYKSAQNELIQYLDNQKLDAKKRWLGELNLANCFVENNEFGQANDILSRLQRETKTGYWHVYLNSLETRGQLCIKEGNAGLALEILKRALEYASGQEGTTRLFIQKWYLVALCLAGKIKPESEEVESLRIEIRKQKHWESLRDFDWHLGRIFGESHLLKGVYFGTPFPSFRQVMLRDLNETSFGNSFEFQGGARSPEKKWDPFNYKALDLPAGLGQHRLIMLMASDAYRPWTIGRIFNDFFSDELFDPVSSPKRVYRLVEKAINHLKGKDLGVQIHSTQSGYRIRPDSKAAMIVYENMQFAAQEHFLLQLLKHNNIGPNFRPREVMDQIPLSSHKWYRALQRMEELGLLEKTSDQNLCYKIVS